jgi:hypothetical protein
MSIAIIRGFERKVIDENWVMSGDLVLDIYGQFRPVLEFPMLAWRVSQPRPTLPESLAGLAVATLVTVGAIALLKGAVELLIPLYNDAPLSHSTRNYIRQRDKEICYYCDGWDPNGHVDHMTSRANGGGNEDENLTWACSPCNLTKGRLNADAFIEAYE